MTIKGGRTVVRLPSMRLLIVEPSAIPGNWEWMRQVLSRAIERDDTRSIRDVYDGLVDGLFRAFIVSGEIEGVVVAAINGPALRICYVGGRIEPPARQRVGVLMRAIEHLARQSGCTEVVCAGRAGWARLLDGYDRNTEGGLPTFRKVLTCRT